MGLATGFSNQNHAIWAQQQAPSYGSGLTKPISILFQKWTSSGRHAQTSKDRTGWITCFREEVHSCSSLQPFDAEVFRISLFGLATEVAQVKKIGEDGPVDRVSKVPLGGSWGRPLYECLVCWISSRTQQTLAVDYLLLTTRAHPATNPLRTCRISLEWCGRHVVWAIFFGRRVANSSGDCQ